MAADPAYSDPAYTGTDAQRAMTTTTIAARKSTTVERSRRSA